MISKQSNKKVLPLANLAPSLAASLFLAGAMAFAQQTPGGAQSPMGQQPGGSATYPGGATPGSATPGSAAPGGAATGMPMPSETSPQSYADQSFLRKTLEDDAAEVQMGQLAAQKSSSGDVKQFGAKMAQIHQQLTDQIKPIAKKLDVDVPKQPSKKDRQQIQKMQTLSGADFDAAFIKAMLKDQQSDLKDFKDEAKASQDPNVQQLAKVDTPVLSQHLQILQQLAQAHNVTAEDSK